MTSECIACASSWPSEAFCKNGDCGHAACVGCTTQILRDALGDKTKVTSGGVACIFPQCPARLDMETIRRVAAQGAALLPDDRALSGQPAEPIQPRVSSVPLGCLIQDVLRARGSRLSDVEVEALGSRMRTALIPRERRLSCPQCALVMDVPVAPRASKVTCSCGFAVCGRCRDVWDGHGLFFSSCEARAELVEARDRGSSAYVEATSKACPECAARVTHWHGHACHHISPSMTGPATGGCGILSSGLDSSRDRARQRNEEAWTGRERLL